MVAEGKALKRSTPGWTGFFERGLFAPFLLSIQPVLQLFVINLGELDFSEILRPLLLSLLFAGLVFGLTNLLLRHPQKASLVASLFIFLLFLFGDLSRWVAKTFGLGPVRANLIVLADSRHHAGMDLAGPEADQKYWDSQPVFQPAGNSFPGQPAISDGQILG